MSYSNEITMPGVNPDVDAYNLLNAVLHNNWPASEAIDRRQPPDGHHLILATMTAWLSIVLLGLHPADREHILAHFREIIGVGFDAGDALL